MAGIPACATTAEATAMLRAGLAFLAAADPTRLAAAEQARILAELEQATAIATAARASVLGGFPGPAGGGP